MSNVRMSQKEKKIIRNQEILVRYNEIKKTKTCRNAMDDLALETGLGLSTIRNILFNRNYSNSPRPDSNTMPKKC